MTYLSDRVLNLAESETLAMARLATELKEKGVNVINMGLGEPDFKTPDFIKQAAKEAIDKDFSFYTPVPGYKDLLEAICLKFKRDNGLEYKPSQVFTSTGAKQSIANAVFALVNPGDEVILPAPYWVSYAEMVQLAGGKVVEIRTDLSTNFKITPEQLEKVITTKTKLFLFSNPSNPTGVYYNKQELAKLKDVFVKHSKIVVISDEIYEHIHFEEKPYSFANFPEMYARTLTVNGLSKAYAMTGWRLGYAAGPEDLVKACVKIQGQFTSATCSITQRAAITALKADPKVEITPMCEAFKRRRDLIVQLMSDVPNVKCNRPNGAFYLFPHVASYYGKSYQGRIIKDSKDLCMYLLDVGHVSLTPGAAFGAPDFIRFSYATSEDNIREAVARFKKALADLK